MEKISTSATPLAISNIVARVGAANTQMIVSWSPNQPCWNQVNYGLTSAYGSSTQPQGEFTTPNILIAGLTCGTTIHYQVVSYLDSGEKVVSPDATLVLKPCTATLPVITVLPPTSNNNTSFNVNFKVNEITKGDILYGLEAGNYTNSLSIYNGGLLNFNTSNSILLHQMIEILSSDFLPCGTPIHYQIVVQDAAGNKTQTGDLVYETQAGNGANCPVITNVNVRNFPLSTTKQNLQILYSWNTNAPCYFFFRFRPSGSTAAWQYDDVYYYLTTSPNGNMVQGGGGNYLNCNTAYDWQVGSVDANGNMSLSPQGTITTKSC